MSSKRHVRESECSGKIAYENRYLANLEAKRIYFRKIIPDRVRPYQCKWCGKWHIGHVSSRFK